MKALAASLPPRPSAVASNRTLPSAAANEDRGTSHPSLASETQMNTSSQTLSAEFLNRLRSFVRRRVRTDADADDVVQDVLTRLVQRGSPPSGSVHAWLFTVARNAIIDRARKRRNHGNLDVLELAETTPEPADAATKELARCLGPMMSGLAPDDQLVLTRIDLQGESQSDLAREFGLSASGMKSRVQRARRRLRALLEGCCSLDRDSQGKPFDYEKRSRTDCQCCGASPAGCE